MDRTLRIGTRGSKLALWQANFTKEKLEPLGLKVELVIIKTKGDQIQHLGFDKMEGKGFFTKEIEEALLSGAVDMAVHSMKDLPTTSPDGLVISAVSYRENPADWLLIHPGAVEENNVLSFKQGAIVGTSSARRKAQIKDLRNDVNLKDIRGNVPTRIEKLRQGEFDAILLAAAGIERLELTLDDLKIVPLHPREFVPAPAQGVLAFQTRKEDVETRRILKNIHEAKVAEVTNVERKVLQLFDGGCQLPLGVYCEKDSTNNFHVWAAMSQSSSGKLVRAKVSSSTSYELAETVVEKLKSES